MAKREEFKTWEFEGRRWRIGKFDPMTGSYIVYKLMSELLPMGIGQQAGIPAPPAGSSSMSKVDFFDMQRDCLSVVAEILPAGVAPVMTPNGFGVQDLDHDAPTVLAMTIQVLIWNAKDFFTESLLSSFQEEFKSLFPPSMLTSIPGFTPQSS
jgi:hypothetical protein